MDESWSEILSCKFFLYTPKQSCLLKATFLNFLVICIRKTETEGTLGSNENKNSEKIWARLRQGLLKGRRKWLAWK